MFSAHSGLADVNLNVHILIQLPGNMQLFQRVYLNECKKYILSSYD